MAAVRAIPRINPGMLISPFVSIQKFLRTGFAEEAPRNVAANLWMNA
jgi:hypothetical protein